MTREQYITLTEATRDALRRFLAALCSGDCSLADDIAQETYIKAYMAIDSVRNPRAFRSWIYRIAYNTFINHKRTQRLFVDTDSLADMPDRDDDGDADFRDIDNERLHDALRRLPPKERTALLLYYMEDYSVKDIAGLLDATCEAVRQHLSRGRKHLKTYLTTSPHRL